MDITEKLNSVRDQVLVDIKEKALITGESFKLASGQTSSHYVNCKELTLEAACLERVAKLFCGHLLRFDHIPSAQISRIDIHFPRSLVH